MYERDNHLHRHNSDIVSTVTWCNHLTTHMNKYFLQISRTRSGTHRPNWPVYGEYAYVPVQRWLHSLEHGAIVALYHPCANRQQINELRELINACIYRHVITAYEKLSAENPFALVAWGKSLEMSYIDRSIVVGFIRMNALQAPEKISRDGLYNAGLVDKANIVSDINDSNLCPNM